MPNIEYEGLSEEQKKIFKRWAELDDLLSEIKEDTLISHTKEHEERDRLRKELENQGIYVGWDSYDKCYTWMPG